MGKREIGLQVLLLFLSFPLFGQEYGTVLKQQKISNNDGNLSFNLSQGSFFGSGITGVGDLDKDGNNDVMVGASLNSEIYTLFLDSTGRVISHQKIGSETGGWDVTFGLNTRFGSSITYVGDINNDGISDVLVGESLADYGGRLKGGAWLIFLNSDGTVKNYNQISDTATGFKNQLNEEDEFGNSVSSVGDLDQDGLNEFAIGASEQNSFKGAIWVFFPNEQGEIEKFSKIDHSDVGIANSTSFGSSITSLGDLNQDGIPDLAVGASSDSEKGRFKGALWIIFLNRDGTVKNSQKITEQVGNFNDSLNEEANFGHSVANLRDINGDSIPDLAVGAFGEQYKDTSANKLSGKVWVLFLNRDGKVKSSQAIGNGFGDFQDTVFTEDRFGSSLTNIGDLNGDSVPELGIGAMGDNDGEDNAGAVYILFLNGVPQSPDDTTSGIQSDGFFKRLHAYPMPISPSQALTLQLPFALSKGQRAKVTLFDVKGRLVHKRDFTYQGQARLKLDLPALAPGNYQLFLTAGEFQGFSKIVIK